MATKTMRNRFAELSMKFPLRPIRTDIELETAEAVAHSILRKASTTRDEEDYLETLSLLIGDYEDAHYPDPPETVTAADALRFMLEQHGKTQAEVAKGTGIPVSSLSEMATGKRGIGAKHAVALGKYFSANPALFLPPSQE